MVVSIDGVTFPTISVEGDFLGCIVDAGVHRVEFSFMPRSFVYGSGYVGHRRGIARGSYRCQAAMSDGRMPATLSGHSARPRPAREPNQAGEKCTDGEQRERTVPWILETHGVSAVSRRAKRQLAIAIKEDEF